MHPVNPTIPISDSLKWPLRLAREADAPALEALIPLSVRTLQAPCYSPAQMEAALGPVFGVDRQLIRDGTYFVAEANGELIACGGWSYRRTLFGGDDQPDRVADRLDPVSDAARIRAFFVHPAWARRGLGRVLLARCEGEAREHGFAAAELMATLPGRRLYLASGYVEGEPRSISLDAGESIVFVPMHKVL